MGSFVSMGSSTFGLGLCYNTHTVLLRLLKEDPNETLFKILLASFIFSSNNTFKDIKVSYVQIASNHCHEMWP